MSTHRSLLLSYLQRKLHIWHITRQIETTVGCYSEDGMMTI